jgi:hypothetical protein
MKNATDHDLAEALVHVIGDSKWIAVALAHGYLALVRGESESASARIVFDRGGATLKRSREVLLAMTVSGFASQLPLRERTGSAENPVTKLFPATITEQRFLESLDEITSRRTSVTYTDERETGHGLTDFTLREAGEDLPINIKNAGTRFERAKQLVGLDPDDCIPIPAYKAHAAVEARPSLIYIVSADYDLVGKLKALVRLCRGEKVLAPDQINRDGKCLSRDLSTKNASHSQHEAAAHARNRPEGLGDGSERRSKRSRQHQGRDDSVACRSGQDYQSRPRRYRVRGQSQADGRSI